MLLLLLTLYISFQRVTSPIATATDHRTTFQRKSPSIESTASFKVNTNNVPADNNPNGLVSKSGPFDYLYEFSETRKVLEDFFKSPDEPLPSDCNDSEIVS